MKFFKIKPSRTAQWYKIQEDAFQQATQKKYPFVQREDKKRAVAFGICPLCLNPIQLVGILHKTKVTPYGKHAGKEIAGLAKWNYKKYEYCPYAVKRKNPPSNKKALENIDDSAIEIYNLLRDQFDRVVYVLEKKLHIRCSHRFWEDVLGTFINMRGFCDPTITELNLPYMVAYWGMLQENCYAQYFEVGTDIYVALDKYPGVMFQKTGQGDQYRQLRSSGRNISLVFRTLEHRQTMTTDEELKESMIFCIDDNYIGKGKTVFEQTVEFDEAIFIKLITKKGNEDKRNQSLLDIARKIMPPLKLTENEPSAQGSPGNQTT